MPMVHLSPEDCRRAEMACRAYAFARAREAQMCDFSAHRENLEQLRDVFERLAERLKETAEAPYDRADPAPARFHARL